MLPIIARTLFRIQERMLGRESFRLLAELNESQYFPRQRLRELQFDRLATLLRRARDHTPYWREVMDARGIDPAGVRSMDELRRFPLLEKQTLRDRREDMAWTDQGTRVRLVRTSGSTNEALEFYTSSTREAAINAARMRGHEWCGIRRGMREMYFWGSPVELSKQDRIKRARDWLINDGLTNGFELNRQRVEAYFEYWKRWRPRCLFGYPSSFTLMVSMARSLGLDLSELARRGLKAVITTSEMLVDADRELIAESFATPVYDSYGLREAGLIGHECEENTMHTVDEQLILETIDPATGEPTDGEGELVVTNLVGPAEPIIRYRTGDIVTLSREPCPCGRTLGRVDISGGRAVDFVVTADGRWIVGYAFIYVSRSVPGIVKFQGVQDRMGEIRIRIVTDENFPADGVQRVRQGLLDRLASEDEVVVEVVDDIAPAPSGKYRPVISKVAQQLRAEQDLRGGAGEGGA